MSSTFVGRRQRKHNGDDYLTGQVRTPLTWQLRDLGTGTGTD